MAPTAERARMSWHGQTPGRLTLSPLTITLAYLAFSIAWIVFSDQLVAIVPDRASAERLQSIKGTLFVTATSLIIFMLVTRYRALLLARAEAQAAERQRRAHIERLVGGLRPDRTPERTAARICSAVCDLPGIGMTTYFANERGRLNPVAAYPSAGGIWSPGIPLPDELANEIRARTESGAWVAEVSAGSAGPLADTLAGAGYGDATLAAVRHRGAIVGILIAAATPPASAAAQLEAIVEIGRVAGAWLGPPTVAQRARDRRRGALRRAAADFEIAFQPIIDLSRGRPVGYEALSRFGDGSSTAERFAEAVELDMSLELEEAAIRRAVADATRLPPRRWLALNVSGALLLDRRRLAHALVDADRPIVLELTERQPIPDYGAVRATLAELGPSVRLAIDDMGEAFSGLRHLVELAPAFAKLDLALVRAIDTDPIRQALVAGLRHYTLQAGADLIAEGIETVAERRALQQLGVGLAQGFLFGRPAVAEKLAARTRPTSPIRRLPRQHQRADHEPIAAIRRSEPG